MPSNHNANLLQVAIIGAGPAGYYTAESLTKPDASGNIRARVDILDKLPTPYGLIRAGVAPDHQSIKRVSARYEKTNVQKHVRFVGNISLGKDITLEELMSLYDAVVLATGAGKDRSLGLENEDLPGIIGSGTFVGWYNAHPDFAGLEPDLNVPSVGIIGNGNVAVDVARILAKTAAEMQTSDLPDYAANRIHASPIKDIYVLGRRGPLQAAFTPKELGELNKLENCVALVDSAQLPDSDEGLKGAQAKNMAVLRAMAKNRPEDKPVRLHMMFYRQPVQIVGHNCLCGLQVEETELINGKAVGTGRTEIIPMGLLVPCIGYRTSPIPDVPFDQAAGRFKNKDGLITKGLYCTGWARRGPVGTIGTNKPDGGEIAERILKEVPPDGKAGRDGLDAIIRDRCLNIVTFRDWKRIEAAEEAAAEGDQPRSKMVDVPKMIRIAHQRKSADTSTSTASMPRTPSSSAP